MNPMSAWLELHDSRLVAIEQGSATIRLLLDGYIHRWDMADGDWKGTGWIQPVQITVGNVATQVVSLKLPVEIADGVLQCGNVSHDSVMPLPFETPEAVSLWLEVATDEGGITIDGRGLRIEAVGEARFLENLPADLRPNAD